MVKDINPKDMAQIEKDLWAENKAALQKEPVTLQGGAGHGSEFMVPNGVSELSVETAFGVHWYIRNPEESTQFIPRLEL